jgi:hypothetical protein
VLFLKFKKIGEGRTHSAVRRRNGRRSKLQLQQTGWRLFFLEAHRVGNSLVSSTKHKFLAVIYPNYVYSYEKSFKALKSALGIVFEHRTT